MKKQHLLGNLLKDSELYVIAGRKNVGKTVLSVNLLEEIKETTEEKAAVFVHTDIIDKEIDERLAKAGVIRSDATNVNLGMLFCTLKWIKEDKGLGLVVIDDFFHLIKTQPFKYYEPTKREMAAYILSSLSHAATLLDVPIVVTTDVDDYVDVRWSKVPKMEDILFPEIVQEFASKVILLYRDEMYYPDTERPACLDMKIIDTKLKMSSDYVLAFLKQYLNFLPVNM